MPSRADAELPLPTAKVHFADLDLTHAEGSVELYRRIHTAARNVCRSLDPRESVIPLALKAHYEDCMSNAINGAVAQVNRAEFSAYVQGRDTPSKTANLKLAAR